MSESPPRSLFFRLFRAGRMPPPLAEVASEPGVLFAEEGLSVHVHVRNLRLPRRRINRGVSVKAGALVLTRGRALASIGPRILVDVLLSPGATSGEATLTFGADGARMSFEISSFTANGSGSVVIHYRVALDETLLAQLPSECRVPIRELPRF